VRSINEEERAVEKRNRKSERPILFLHGGRPRSLPGRRKFIIVQQNGAKLQRRPRRIKLV
jgi:hypothetical protein